MILSRCAVLVASGLCVSWAARIQKRRRAPNQQEDCCSLYDGQPLVHLNATTEVEHLEMSKAVQELLCTEAGEDDFLETTAICSKSAIAALKDKFGQRMAVVQGDAGEFFRHSSGVARPFYGMSSAFYSDWRDYESRLGRVQALVDASGGVATLEEVGRSIEDRPIYTVRIKGAGFVPGGPRLVANFQQHAREWITGMTGVYAVEQAIAKAKVEPQWLAGAELMLIPLSNPDGILYSENSDRMWRKNRRDIQGSSCMGVDMNRNWLPGWVAGGSYCGQTYSGTSGFSEPETQAIRSVIDESFTTIHMDIHSYSQLIMVPFGYTRTPHPQRAVMDVIGQAMQQAIRDTHGIVYEYGGSELLGWTKGVSRDYNAGVSDGFSFLFELRPGRSGAGGFAPPASEILPTAEEFTAALYAAIDWVQNPSFPTTPVPTPAPPPGTWQLTGSGCVMDGSCIHSKNYPQNYGNSEQCSVKLNGGIPLAVDGEFLTERNYDKLIVGDVEYSGTPPSNLADLDGVHTGTLYWQSDSSVTKKGWKICRTDA